MVLAIARMNLFTSDPFAPKPEVPLYQQLYSHLREAILAGRLPSGMKLPSTRALAEELRVARNTVLAAYHQLTDEGYIESVEGSGTFVADILPEQLLTVQKQDSTSAPAPPSTETPAVILSQRARSQMTSPQILLSLPPTTDGRQRPFSLGMSALEVFPYQLWARLIARQARQMSAGTLTYQHAAGYPPLCRAIAEYLTVVRGLRCTPEQIVVVAGAQGGFDLAARLLVDAGDQVWMEDPGYVGARGAFLGAGAEVIPIPVDGEGLRVDVGMARAPQAQMAYVTPAHQFPLGVNMSLPRRLALLEWAKQNNTYILEDDYDSEYRFAGRPLPTLHSLDSAGRVIYIGTFSKVLAPALRIGYLVLPPELLKPFLAVRRFVDFHTPILEQSALADFMADGHFARHLRRMRTHYAEQRLLMLELLGKLPLELHAAPVGSHCIGWLPAGFDTAKLRRQAIEADLNLWLISTYSIQPLPRDGLIFGYGAYCGDELRDAVGRLAAVIQQIWPEAKRQKRIHDLIK